MWRAVSAVFGVAAVVCRCVECHDVCPPGHGVRMSRTHHVSRVLVCRPSNGKKIMCGVLCGVACAARLINGTRTSNHTRTRHRGQSPFRVPAATHALAHTPGSMHAWAA
eukprot:1271837-Prymnesium_polylepis.2